MKTILAPISWVISLFGFWGWLELIAAAIVAYGCAGELWLLLIETPQHAGHTGSKAKTEKLWRLLKRALRPVIERAVLLGVRTGVFGRKMSPSKKHRLERHFVTMVAFGVSIEVLALSFSLRETARMGKDAAEARLRAADAELKLEELKAELAWRTISPKQTADLIKRLKPLADSLPKGQKAITVQPVGDNMEVRQYAFEIASALEKCGFETSLGGLSLGFRISEGVLIAVKDRNNPPPYAQAIVEAFKQCAIGLPISAEEFRSVKNGEVMIWVFARPAR